MAVIQDAYRWYEDGTESGSAAIDAQDAAITRTVNSDSNLLLRVRIESTQFMSNFPEPVWRLQCRKNSGSWANVTTTSSNAKGFNSSNLTDNDPTTERLTGGVTTWTSGFLSEDGEIDGKNVTTNRYTEFLYSLTIIEADVSDADVLEFRVLIDGLPVDTYTVTPTLTVSKGGGGGTGIDILGVWDVNAVPAVWWDETAQPIGWWFRDYVTVTDSEGGTKRARNLLLLGVG